MAAELLRYNSTLHCRYCDILSIKNLKSLQYHVRTYHSVPESVNRKDGLAVPPFPDMVLCTVCNLYLDRGLSFTGSSHQRSTFHAMNMGIVSLDSDLQFPAKKSRTECTFLDGEDGDREGGGRGRN